MPRLRRLISESLHVIREARVRPGTEFRLPPASPAVGAAGSGNAGR
jgi:hypothetical protein